MSNLHGKNFELVVGARIFERVVFHSAMAFIFKKLRLAYAVKEVAKFIKNNYKDVKIRVNTNGHANFIYKRNILQ